MLFKKDTNYRNLEQAYACLKDRYDQIVAERESLYSLVDKLTGYCEGLEKRIDTLTVGQESIEDRLTKVEVGTDTLNMLTNKHDQEITYILAWKQQNFDGANILEKGDLNETS